MLKKLYSRWLKNGNSLNAHYLLYESAVWDSLARENLETQEEWEEFWYT